MCLALRTGKYKIPYNSSNEHFFYLFHYTKAEQLQNLCHRFISRYLLVWLLYPTKLCLLLLAEAFDRLTSPQFVKEIKDLLCNFSSI